MLQEVLMQSKKITVYQDESRAPDLGDPMGEASERMCECQDHETIEGPINGGESRTWNTYTDLATGKSTGKQLCKCTHSTKQPFFQSQNTPFQTQHNDNDEMGRPQINQHPG